MQRSNLVDRPIIDYRLYAIADTGVIDEKQFEQRVAEVLAGGASVIQYRDKSDDQNKRLRQAQLLRALTADHQATLIINDDVHLAAVVGADGVHLGEDDASIGSAREQFGHLTGVDPVIGLSCYNDLQRAVAAEVQQVDYVAFGRCFPSTTKPGERYVSLQQIKQARDRLAVPIIGIGGITLDNAPQLLSAGVDGIALIASLFAVKNSQHAAQAFRRMFDHQP